MRKRIKTLTIASVSLVALALGGSAIASATQGTPSASKHSTVHATKHVSKHAAKKSAGRESVGLPDTDNIQSGDQTSPDPAGKSSSSTSSESTSETSSESSSENETSSDGPGGHEDPAGDVQFESEAQE